MKKILTIAGSDSGGGAGIQADLKTIQAHGMYGMSVITAVTAQNTKSVFQVDAMSPESVEAQLDAVLSDLLPDAVKIGMVYDTAVIHIIAEKLKQYQPPHIVVDTPIFQWAGAVTAGSKGCTFNRIAATGRADHTESSRDGTDDRYDDPNHRRYGSISEDVTAEISVSGADKRWTSDFAKFQQSRYRNF